MVQLSVDADALAQLWGCSSALAALLLRDVVLLVSGGEVTNNRESERARFGGTHVESWFFGRMSQGGLKFEPNPVNLVT